MYNYTLSQIAGFATLLLMASSYLVKSKKAYLAFQISGLCCMFLSYLFAEEHFAMITLAVSFFRTVTYYAFEAKNKDAPVAFAYIFSFLAICAYFAVNSFILNTAKPVDIIYLTAQIMYAFIFRIRSIQLVRYLMLIPNSLAVLYNLLLGDMLFVAASYLFELLAGIFAIFRYSNKKRK